MALWALRMIMAIERDQAIRNDEILLQIKTLFFYEKKCFGINSNKLKARWGELIELFQDML